MNIQIRASLDWPMNCLDFVPKGTAGQWRGKASAPFATFNSMDTLLSREAMCVRVAGIKVPCFSNAIAAAPFVDACAGNYRFHCVTRMLIEMIEEIDPRQGLARSQIFDFTLQSAQAIFTRIK